MSLFRLITAACLATLFIHITVLLISGQNWISTPVSQLSRGPWGWLQSLGLVLFALAHMLLAWRLSGLDHGRLWPYGRGLLLLAGLALVYVVWYFFTAQDNVLFGPNANDPLWIVASLTGLAMGALQPGLSRLSRLLGLFSSFCLGMWLLLVPLILLVDERWLGAYERLVGTTYILWLGGISAGLHVLTRPRT